MINVCKCFAGKYNQIATHVKLRNCEYVKLHGTTHRLRNQLGSNFFCMGIICFCGIANNLKRNVLREKHLEEFFLCCDIHIYIVTTASNKAKNLNQVNKKGSKKDFVKQQKNEGGLRFNTPSCLD